ncbi:MAG: CRISPR-associated protein Cas4 [Gammaproteobacteria bacterium]
MIEDNYLALSALQHYAYCPRQCALIHVEQAWSENVLTAEGRLLHERVDTGDSEQRGNIRTERGVTVISHRLRITGKLDLLEVEGKPPRNYFPVEYKRGKPKVESWDRVQLCAQALCLEEMCSVDIKEAALWYWQVRRREVVVIDAALREHTESIINSAQKMIQSGNTPRAMFNKRCKACSLIGLCEPNILQHDHSALYVSEIFTP